MVSTVEHPDSLHHSNTKDEAVATSADGSTEDKGSIAVNEDEPITGYGEFSSEGKGLKSVASICRDGRISVTFDLKNGLSEVPQDLSISVEEFAIDEEWTDHPAMNIVIMIVGSRGDVQPYVALGKQLKNDGHRIRIASHETFRKFVNEAGLEFFNIGGDPHDLMSYMVKNPGLMPGFASLTNGDIPKKRKMLAEMIDGCWQSCHAPCPTTGNIFIADAIISNPPAFAHVHCAEALGIPLLLSFTMPWSPTTAFAHPLVNIKQSNAKRSITNYLTYATSEFLQWEGVGDIINKFRENTLNLPPLSIHTGPGLVDKLHVPWTYCMSPALVPKPEDWKAHIDVVGFYFLDLASNYTPPDDLRAFLEAGVPPVYIGFGSIVVDDPGALSEIIFKATEAAGVRALVSAGWGGLGGFTVPPHIFMLGNIPHDWLFDQERVSAVVHHGGAGTTAIGLAKGRPTVVVPFFGDQGFWGSMIHKAGAGPKPIPHKELTIESLREAITFAVSQKAKEAAYLLAQSIHDEDGVRRGAESFYKHLPLLNMRCDIDPSRVAVWWSEEHCLKLSTFAAQILVDAHKIEYKSLSLHRSKEFHSPSTSSILKVADNACAFFWNVSKLPFTLPYTALKRVHKFSSEVMETIKEEDSEVKHSLKYRATSIGRMGLKTVAKLPIISAATHPYRAISKILRSRASSSPTYEQEVRQTRMNEGKDAIRTITSTQHSWFVHLFEEEIAQIAVRRKRHHDTVRKWQLEQLSRSDVEGTDTFGHAGGSSTKVSSASSRTISSTLSSMTDTPGQK